MPSHGNLHGAYARSAHTQSISSSPMIATLYALYAVPARMHPAPPLTSCTYSNQRTTLQGNSILRKNPHQYRLLSSHTYTNKSAWLTTPVLCSCFYNGVQICWAGTGAVARLSLGNYLYSRAWRCELHSVHIHKAILAVVCLQPPTVTCPARFRVPLLFRRCIYCSTPVTSVEGVIS